MFHGSSPLLSCQRRRSNGQTTMICSVLTWSRRWKENGKKGGKRNKAGERLKRNADIEKKKNKPWGIKICIVKQICQCKTKCHGIFSLKSWTDFEFESYNRKSSREMKEKKKKRLWHAVALWQLKVQGRWKLHISKLYLNYPAYPHNTENTV